MKSLALTLFLCLPLFTFSQRDTKIIQEDFSGDGNLEELRIHSYLGKIDFVEVTYENGTKKCTLDVSPNIESPTLINTVPLCDDLLLPQYKSLTQGIDKYIFNVPATKSVDPTLGWILDVYATKKNLKNHPYFESYSRFKPKIKKTYYTAPIPHRLLVKGKLVRKINRKHHKADTTRKSWILLDANRFTTARQISEYNLEPDWPQLVDSMGSINIFKTGHSVYIETDTAHQVVFVSDGVLYNNIQKISWESIQQVGKYKNYILVLTHPYPAIENKLFMIDTKKGRVFEFKKNIVTKYDDYFRYIESFEVMEDELFLFLKESPTSKSVEEKTIPFILLKESLEAFNKKKVKRKKKTSK